MSSGRISDLDAVGVASPVVRHLLGTAGQARLVGVTRAAAYIDIGGFLAAVSPGQPVLPNGVAVETCCLLEDLARGHPLRIRWDPLRTRVWEMRLPAGLPRDLLGERGKRILSWQGIDVFTSWDKMAGAFATAGLTTPSSPSGRKGVALLLRAIADRDPVSCQSATKYLIGRGPGLTPEGDDILSAAAAVVAASVEDGAAIVAALVPPDVGERTTTLSSTLLRLAAKRHVPMHLGSVLDLSVSDAAWRTAADSLRRIGATTGLAYAISAAAVAFALGRQ